MIVYGLINHQSDGYLKYSQSSLCNHLSWVTTFPKINTKHFQVKSDSQLLKVVPEIDLPNKQSIDITICKLPKI